jgi:hypothetical protein
MSIVTYNNRSIANISAIPGAAKSLTHIKTLTASSSANLSFVNGSSDVVLDSTYPIYLFKFVNVHPATDAQRFTVNFRDGGSSYDATKTTTRFLAYHTEGDSAALAYEAGEDVAQGTGVQNLTGGLGNGNDESASGELWLFSPSSTTYVKHFIARTNYYHKDNGSEDVFVAGYCNVTAAIDGVQFAMASGNIDAGTIKLYGLKDS